MPNVKSHLRDIAQSTLASVSAGKVSVNGLVYDLSGLLAESAFQTAYYAPDSLLSAWASAHPSNPTTTGATIEILQTTTLAAARAAAIAGRSRPIGLLNFASAEQPGGGFINGANAQEESIARSGSLYASLMTPTAQQFYSLHTEDGKGGWYTHAMVYSPRIVLFRDDDGAWVPPMEVDVLTSPAVHAGLVRKRSSSSDVEAKIARTMRERMARLLFLFERRQVRTLVLGSFGTGVFQNDVDTVAAIWAELLSGRFKTSFDYVAFAVVDGATCGRFRKAFEKASK
ncbi:hypothetical protein DFH07DRAFT_904326 [Mycena maculata]|uniref:Microbial-type PARG catalytic domain-containing protein n=1 Tax=Mycena maculata TaxID=230809 RepID=A0AAD7IVH6_9AGAR|nr:hypothetical protein DFH07DRAFT_904326 [Mycena maculata]